MSVLLDTQAFLWFIFDDARLSSKAARTIADPGIGKRLSIASLWEITIKVQIGKLELGVDLEQFFERYVTRRLVEPVAIELSHLVAYSRLPLLHRDPFDRLLVAQAHCLEVPIVTADPRLEPYGVEVIW